MITYRPWRLKRKELAFYAIHALPNTTTNDVSDILVLYISVSLIGSKRNLDDACEVIGNILRNPLYWEEPPTERLKFIRDNFYKTYPNSSVEDVTSTERDILNCQFIRDSQIPYRGEFVKIPLRY